MTNRISQNFAPKAYRPHTLSFTVERIVLVRMLKFIARRAPLRGRPAKMVRLSACGPRVFVEANGKSAATEALVFGEGSCCVVHQAFLRLLRSRYLLRHCVNVTFTAERSIFSVNQVVWPLAAFSPRVFPPATYQEFAFTQTKRQGGRR
jgi:hypothetical protein